MSVEINSNDKVSNNANNKSNVSTKTDIKLKKINPKTAYKQLTRHKHEEASIVNGLSSTGRREAKKATERTQEKGYSIFNKQKLMPESYGELISKTGFSIFECSGYEGSKKYTQTPDGRIRNYDNYDGSHTVYYDSDGIDGFDRSATYRQEECYPENELDENYSEYGLFKDDNISKNYIKVEETFDANGNGINEVIITRNPLMHTKQYLEQVKGLIFSKNEIKLKSHEWATDYSIKVNRDDTGFDKINGYHWEYEETSRVNIEDDSVQTLIELTEWLDKDLPNRLSQELQYYENGKEINLKND